MTEQVRENYFIMVKIILISIMEIYLVITQNDLAGTSAWVLLLLAVFLGLLIAKEILTKRFQLICLIGAAVVCIATMTFYGLEYIMLVMILVYEFISFQESQNPISYIFPIVLGFMPTDIYVGVQLLAVILMALIYYQHDMIIISYRKRLQEDTNEELRLKKNISMKEIAFKEEMDRGLLRTENMLLEEKTRLAQTLHDKLGHSINGSIYQLEAVKVLMDQDTQSSKAMIQAVIDNLRTGMDEIRAILRKERPEKYKLAMLQLQQLRDECAQVGVQASLNIIGELENIPEKYLEIVLDNAFEAVTNSLKYSKCTKLEIKVHVMNQMLRCSVTDNGCGCSEIVDGMGISGMRKRMRSVNGILDFDTESGFSVNMLFPLPGR